MAESPVRGTFSFSTPQKRVKALSALNRHPVAGTLLEALGSDSQLHHVGGSVRDALLGREVHDLDFSCALAPAEILTRLVAHNVRALEMSAKHGTIIAVIDGKSYEITQFRDPGCSCDGDLRLRDFTINALALPVARNSESDVIDPTGGLSDLEARVIRGCIDPSTRIVEDPLRILRGIRFGPARGFLIEAATESAMRAHRGLLSGVSPERIRNELELILLSEDPRSAFRMLRDLKILDVILPEMLPSVGSEQNEWHVEDVFEHTLTVVCRAEKERIQRWCALFHDLGKPATASVDTDGRRHFYGHERVSETIALAVMERLRFSTDDTRLIALLVRQHMRPTSVGEAGVRRIIRDLGAAFPEWRKFKWADAAPALDPTVVQDELNRFDALVEAERNRPVGSVYSALAVDGNDLLGIGMSPGKELGGILKALHERVLDDPALNAKETLLQLAKEMLDAKE